MNRSLCRPMSRGGGTQHNI